MKMVELNGIKIKFRERDKGIIDEVFKEDPYRIEEIPEHSIVIDGGAHIGTVSLRCAVERGSRVYAYEPSDDTFNLLVENVKINGLEDKVKCFNQAIGGRCEIRNFYVDQLSGSSNLYLGQNPDFADRPLKITPVQCVTIKQIFEENRLEHCDVLKMDVERAEREIFNDEAEPYFRHVDCVMLEWHSYDGHVYADYLERLGFSVLLTGTGMLTPPYDPSFERGMLYAKAVNEVNAGGT